MVRGKARVSADTYKGLIGLHGLNAAESAQLIGSSPQTVSSWYSGSRAPSMPSVMAMAKFFEMPADGLFASPFVDLLPHLVDRGRFERVEQKIAKARRSMKAVRASTVVGNANRLT